MEQTSAARFSREESMRHNREMTQLRREQTVAAQTLGKANKEKNKKEFIIQRQKSELIALKQAVILLSNKDILYNSVNELPRVGVFDHSHVDPFVRSRASVCPLLFYQPDSFWDSGP